MRTWVSLGEWAASVGVSRIRALQWAAQRRIRTVHRYGRHLVRYDEPRPPDRRRKENRT